ncbi:MAG: hypothetical protein WAL56_16650 [Candidatus Sulfotelmatobacter sp.]
MAKVELEIVTVVEEYVPLCATLLAVTLIVFAVEFDGAVNSPVDEMVPALADQVMPVLLVLVTLAENCTVPSAGIDGSAGEICTATHFKQLLTVSV